MSSREKPRVFLTRLIPEPGPSMLREAVRLSGNLSDDALAPDRFLAEVAGVDAILSTPAERVGDEVMAAAGPSLRVISNLAVGYDNIDVPAATARGVLVTNTPGVLTEATADLTWALLLATARRVVEGDRMVRAGRFRGWTPFLLLGHGLGGKTLGLVGMGRIGKAVARRATGFGMRVLYTRATGPLPPGSSSGSAEWEYRDSLSDLLREAHVVSIHVPLSPTTRHLIGPAELALMRPDAILLNTSRGPVVDEGALVEALGSGRLWAAGLDVYEQEPRLTPGLAELENVVLLPHLGSATLEARSGMARMAAANLLAALRNEPPLSAVNTEVMAGWPAIGVP